MYSIVRGGQKVWPYCLECGCRLRVTSSEDGFWITHYDNCSHTCVLRSVQCIPTIEHLLQFLE